MTKREDFNNGSVVITELYNGDNIIKEMTILNQTKITYDNT